jgi:hypothetical protein
MRRSKKRTSAFGWFLLTIFVVLASQPAVAAGALANESVPKPDPVIVEDPLSFVVDESLEVASVPPSSH